MNNNDNKPARTNKLSTTIVIGLATLGLGFVIGAASESGTELWSVAKQMKTPPEQISSTATNGPKTGGVDELNPFDAMRAVQAQMDRSFDRIFDEFRTVPQLNVFQESPGYSLSLDVRDLKDRYEVRAYLPDAKTSDEACAWLETG